MLSWNMLAPLYVRNVDTRTNRVAHYASYPWAEPATELLDWDQRRPRILDALRSADADVICLQEVQFERTADGFGLPSWLADGLASPGNYAVRIPEQRALDSHAARNKRVLNCEAPIGCALLWRADLLEAADDAAGYEQSLRLQCEQAETKWARAVFQRRLNALHEQRELLALRAGVACVSACVRGAEGSALSGLSRLAIFSVHLAAMHEDRRVHQLQNCYESARVIYGTRHVLIAGDFNSELRPGSCARALIRGDGPNAAIEAALRHGRGAAGAESRKLPEGPRDVDLQRECGLVHGLDHEHELPAWRELHGTAERTVERLRIHTLRVPSEGTLSAYPPGEDEGPCRPRRVDHALYSPEVLSPASRWETLEARPSSEVERGTPNYTCPSDHLPLGVAFDLVETEPLGERETERIIARAQSLLSSHRNEAREIKKRIEEASGGKGARERGVLVRSWEQIEDLRKRRRAKHAVLLRHAHERYDFWDSLSCAQQDSVEAAGLILPGPHPEHLEMERRKLDERHALEQRLATQQPVPSGFSSRERAPMEA